MSRKAFALSTVLALLLTIPGFGGEAQAADFTSCFVDLTIPLEATPSSSQVVVINVLKDCTVVTDGPRNVAPAGASTLSTTNSCRLRNLMYGIPGPSEPLTQLDTWQTWTWDGSNVTSRSSWTDYFVASWSGWYLQAGPYSNAYGTPPAWSLEAASSAYFNNSNLNSQHYKENHQFVYGNGNCNGNIRHTGYVCGGCGVVGYIDIF